MKTDMYRVTTTFLGADRPSSFFFDRIEKAQTFYNDECINGEIEKVSVSVDYGEINYSNGCTLCDLCMGDFSNITVMLLNYEDTAYTLDGAEV